MEKSWGKYSFLFWRQLRSSVFSDESFMSSTRNLGRGPSCAGFRMPAHVVMHAASTAIVVIRIVPLLSACTGLCVGVERGVCEVEKISFALRVLLGT